MSLKKSLGKLLIFVALEIGVLAGVRMSPEQIERLMQVMTRTKIVYVIRNEASDD